MSSTTLTGATTSPAATRVKTRKFALRKHDYVFLAFAPLIISPALLALFSVPTLRLFISNPNPVSWTLVGFVVISAVLTAVCCWITYPKDGAK